jgi:hypothetical protein
LIADGDADPPSTPAAEQAHAEDLAAVAQSVTRIQESRPAVLNLLDGAVKAAGPVAASHE